MITELVSGVSAAIALLNGAVALLMYRRYCLITEISLEFAAGVVESFREENDGTVSIEPLDLAARAMDHLSYLGGMSRWVRR